jgi:lysophospholipase L1-like esterase
VNKGVGGNSTEDLLRRVDKDVIAEKPDLVLIMVGTNDMVNTAKLLSFDKYLGNYQTLIDKIKDAGISNIVLLNSLPVDTGYIYERHERKFFKLDPGTKMDSAAVKVLGLAEKNKIHCIDIHSLFKLRGMPNRTADSMIFNMANSGRPDGVHPTPEGYRFIAETVFQYLQSNSLLKEKQKIICFGDSITFGVGVGKGESYPEYLAGMINAE